MPKHIIDQAIKDKLCKDIEIKEYAKIKIYEYNLVHSIIDIKPFNIKRPDTDNTTELLKYQQIFDLNVEIIVRGKLTQ